MQRILENPDPREGGFKYRLSKKLRNDLEETDSEERRLQDMKQRDVRITQFENSQVPEEIRVNKWVEEQEARITELMAKPGADVLKLQAELKQVKSDVDSGRAAERFRAGLAPARRGSANNLNAPK